MYSSGPTNNKNGSLTEDSFELTLIKETLELRKVKEIRSSKLSSKIVQRLFVSLNKINSQKEFGGNSLILVIMFSLKKKESGKKYQENFTCSKNISKRKSLSWILLSFLKKRISQVRLQKLFTKQIIHEQIFHEIYFISFSIVKCIKEGFLEFSSSKYIQNHSKKNSFFFPFKFF